MCRSDFGALWSPKTKQNMTFWFLWYRACNWRVKTVFFCLIRNLAIWSAKCVTLYVSHLGFKALYSAENYSKNLMLPWDWMNTVLGEEFESSYSRQTSRRFSCYKLNDNGSSCIWHQEGAISMLGSEWNRSLLSGASLPYPGPPHFSLQTKWRNSLRESVILLSLKWLW